MKKLKGSATLYFIIFIVMILAFCAFAVDGAIIFTTRAKIQNATESTALAAAAQYNSSNNDALSSEASVIQVANDTFSSLKVGRLKYSTISVKTNPEKKEVLVTTNCPSPTFFLGLLGVGVVNLHAESAAKSSTINVSSMHGGIVWVSRSGAYKSDIVAKQGSYKDTAILTPLGDFSSASIVNNTINFSLISGGDTSPLSLGPGGFITIKLPAPILDKPGNDLYIKEAGTAEGYMVFAGIDNNPEKPYFNSDSQGSGISWVNISCTGTAENIGGTSTAATEGLGVQDAFYGSGYFNLGNSCAGGISMAKYIRIVDDNSETAMVQDSHGASGVYMAKLYGEASTPTAGADIGLVQVLNFVSLIQPSDYEAE